MLFAFAGSDRALGPLGRGGKDEKIYLRQPDRRVEGEPNFLSFFARNPLKSHDSEKEMKVNESDFACFYFHFLSLSSTLSCSARSQAGQLSPRESGRGRRKRRSRSSRSTTQPTASPPEPYSPSAWRWSFARRRRARA